MADDKKEDAQDGLKKLLDKHNSDAMALAGELYSQTFTLRDKNRELRTEVDELKKKLPSDDSVVLSKADAEKWEAYKKLGKVEDINTIFSERDTLKAENAKAKRRELLHSVAETEGFDVDVFASLAPDDLAFEIKEVKDKEGKQIKQAYVTVKDGDKQTIKTVADYVAEQWTKFIPALQPEQKQEGTKYLLQKKGDPPKQESDPVTERLKAAEEVRKANPNPLMKTVPAIKATGS